MDRRAKPTLNIIYNTAETPIFGGSSFESESYQETMDWNVNVGTTVRGVNCL